MNLTLTSLLVGLGAFLIIKLASSFLYKLLGFAILLGLVIYLMFHFGIGPFKVNPVSIYALEEVYCAESKSINKCECIVKPIKQDLLKRWSRDELKLMDERREKMGYAVSKSFKMVRPEIERCLIERNAMDELKEFQHDLIPVENEILEKMSKLKNNITEKSKNALETLINDKESVDSRYKD